MNETKDQFIDRYSGGKPDEFSKYHVALPCDCECGEGSTHWAAVRKDFQSVKDHLELYAPEGTPWPWEVFPMERKEESNDD
jgi:hypothetical protein